MSSLWPDIEPDSDSSDYEESDEGRKYQDKTYYHEQEEVASFPCSNPRRLRQGDKRALQLIKSGI